MGDPYTAAVIGLGRIGSTYSEDRYARSHVSAYLKNPDIDLVAVNDISPEARENFKKNWGNTIPVYQSISEMLEKHCPQIISVCVGPDQVREVIDQCMQNLPEIFFIEKPVFEDELDALHIMRVLEDVPVAVNYHRCWHKEHIEFFQRISSDELNILHVNVCYNKGMFNYACHILVLLIKYFGDVKRIDLSDTGHSNLDSQDPSYSFDLYFNDQLKTSFMGFDNCPYDLLEITVLTDVGLYSINSAGCRFRFEPVKANEFYQGYSLLSDHQAQTINKPVESLEKVVENIIGYLNDNTDTIECVLNDAYKVFQTLSQVRLKFQR